MSQKVGEIMAKSYNEEEWEINNNDGYLLKYKGTATDITIPNEVVWLTALPFKDCDIKNITIKKESEIRIGELPSSLETITLTSKTSINILGDKKIHIPELIILNYGSLSNFDFKGIYPEKITIYGYQPSFEELLKINEQLKKQIPIYYNGILKINPPETLKNFHYRFSNLFLPEGLKTVGIEIENNDKLKTLILPKSATDIEIDYFHWKRNEYCLENLVIPDSINNLNIKNVQISKIYITNNNGDIIHTIEEILKYMLQKSFYRHKIIILDRKLTTFQKEKIRKLKLAYEFYNIDISFSKEEEEEIFNIPKLGTLLPNPKHHLQDEELSAILNSAKTLTSILTIQERIAIEIKIDKLLDEYITNLENLKNKLSLPGPINLRLSSSSPKDLRDNLLLNLNRIIFNLNNVSNYCQKLEEIKECETVLNNEPFPKPASDLATKTLYIKETYHNYHHTTMLEKLKTTLLDYKHQISELLTTYMHNTVLNFEQSSNIDITSLITKYYTSCQNLDVLEATFKGELDNKLSTYLNKIRQTISLYSKDYQLSLSEELNNILKTYFNKALNDVNITLIDIELSLRTDLMSFLTRVMELSSNLITYKRTLDDISLSLNILDETTTEISSHHLISSLTLDIHHLLNSPSLDSNLKDDLINQVKEVLLTWKNKIANNEPLISPEENIAFPLSLPHRIELSDPNLNIIRRILSEIYILKSALETTISVNEECDNLLDTVSSR